MIARRALIIGALAASGCNASGTPHTQLVGTECSGGTSGNGGAAGSGPIDLDGSTVDPFDVHIEHNRIKVSFITLRCAGSCADVVAVASGGSEPYAFAWEDGSTDPARRVCPTRDSTYRISVTDAGTSGEISRPPRTVQAALTADVLDCSDGGGGDAGGSICLTNPSFEGTPALNGDGGVFDAPPWASCDWSPDLYDAALGGLAASHGSTYLSLETLVTELESATQVLCTPLAAGQTVHLLIDLAAWVGSDLELEFYASNPANCGGWGTSPGVGDVWLGTTLPVAATGGWTTQCVTLHAPAEVSVLKLRRKQRTDLATFLYIDNIRPVPACP